MRNAILKQLMELKEEEYQKFQASLIPNCNNMLGVRIPELRKIAKEIAKEDWQTYLKNAKDTFFEEVMLQGMVIGYIKTDIEICLKYIEQFVPKITNWSICDSFCAGLKFTKNNRKKVWNFLAPFLSSKHEFELRFGIVMLLNYYIEEEYINKVLVQLNSIQHEGYYVKMAIAWAISFCFVKYPEQTILLLKSNNLDDFTYNKALQKITELNRVDQDTKNMIRQMKRKNIHSI